MLAIILKKNVFAEGSEVVTLYSRDEGKVRAVARSVKSAKSRLSFGLQDLFLSDVEVATGRGTRGSRASLPVITGVRPVQTFMRLRESDEAVHLALYATELLLKSTPDHEPQPQLYDHFVAYLEHLDRGAHHPLCRTCYTLKFLDLLGYGLNLEQCVVCKDPVPADGAELAHFSVRKSGFLCERDAAAAPDVQTLSADSLRLLARTAPTGFDHQDSCAQGFPNEALQELNAAVQNFVGYVLERELKTVRYL